MDIALQELLEIDESYHLDDLIGHNFQPLMKTIAGYQEGEGGKECDTAGEIYQTFVELTAKYPQCLQACARSFSRVLRDFAWVKGFKPEFEDSNLVN